MASFTLIGDRDGRLARLTWTDGVLSGDSGRMAEVQGAARYCDGRPITHGFNVPTYSAADHLA
jgi:hypothetical protein